MGSGETRAQQDSVVGKKDLTSELARTLLVLQVDQVIRRVIASDDFGDVVRRFLVSMHGRAKHADADDLPGRHFCRLLRLLQVVQFDAVSRAQGQSAYGSKDREEYGSRARNEAARARRKRSWHSVPP